MIHGTRSVTVKSSLTEKNWASASLIAFTASSLAASIDSAPDLAMPAASRMRSSVPRTFAMFSDNLSFARSDAGPVQGTLPTVLCALP
jgi:hypothetical protein